jgi:hypothetical protein
MGIKMMMAVAVTVGLAGCAGTTGSTPDNAVLSAGDVGAIGCAAFAVQGKPADVALARVGVTAAEAVLQADDPTVAALETALAHATLDPKWQAVARVLVSRVEARLHGQVNIPKDGTAYLVADAFVTACGSALGA